jgi:hypothetical protein
MIHHPLIIYKNCSKNSVSSYGIPCQCVELIRRYFNLYFGLTFKSIKDATEMFYKINFLTNITKQAVALYTINAGNVEPVTITIQVGDIIFWKKNKINGYYGHVGIVVYATNETIIIAQQNAKTELEEYRISDIMYEMNKPDSPFLGIKRLPSFVIIPQQIEVIIKDE